MTRRQRQQHSNVVLKQTKTHRVVHRKFTPLRSWRSDVTKALEISWRSNRRKWEADVPASIDNGVLYHIVIHVPSIFLHSPNLVFSATCDAVDNDDSHETVDMDIRSCAKDPYVPIGLHADDGNSMPIALQIRFQTSALQNQLFRLMFMISSSSQKKQQCLFVSNPFVFATASLQPTISSLPAVISNHSTSLENEIVTSSSASSASSCTAMSEISETLSHHDEDNDIIDDDIEEEEDCHVPWDLHFFPSDITSPEFTDFAISAALNWPTALFDPSLRAFLFG
jgi:hypothetical protein